MKYVIGFTGSFLILCLIITTVILPGIPGAQAQEQSQQTEEYSQQRVSEPEISSDGDAYILSEYHGLIAAYKAGQEFPIYISTVRISDLPEADRKCISEGIPAQNRRKLNKLIEEYCS